MRLSALLSLLLTSFLVQPAPLSPAPDVDQQSLLPAEPRYKHCSRPPFGCCDKFCADKTCECECGVRRKRDNGITSSIKPPTSTAATKTSTSDGAITGDSTKTAPQSKGTTTTTAATTSSPSSITITTSEAGSTASKPIPDDGGRGIPNVQTQYVPQSNVIVNIDVVGCSSGCGACASVQSCCPSSSSSNCVSCNDCGQSKGCGNCPASPNKNCRPCSSAGSGKCKDCCCSTSTTGGGECNQTNDCGCGPFPALPPSSSRNSTVTTTTPDPATTPTTPTPPPTTTIKKPYTTKTKDPLLMDPTSVPPVCFICPCLPTYCQPHPIPAAYCPCTPLPTSYPCPIQQYPGIVGYQLQPYYTQYACSCGQGSVEGGSPMMPRLPVPALPPDVMSGGSSCTAPCSITPQTVLCDPTGLVRNENKSVRCVKPFCKLRRIANDEVLIKPEGSINQSSKNQSQHHDEDARMRVINLDQKSSHHCSSSSNTAPNIVIVNVIASFVMVLLF